MTKPNKEKRPPKTAAERKQAYEKRMLNKKGLDPARPERRAVQVYLTLEARSRLNAMAKAQSKQAKTSASDVVESLVASMKLTPDSGENLDELAARLAAELEELGPPHLDVRLLEAHGLARLNTFHALAQRMHARVGLDLASFRDELHRELEQYLTELIDPDGELDWLPDGRELAEMIARCRSPGPVSK